MTSTILEELKMMPHVMKYCRHAWMAIDGGANVGEFTSVMATKFQKVIAVEPVNKTRESLNQRFEFDAGVLVVGDALWHTSGRKLFMAHPAKRTKSTSYYLTTKEKNAAHSVTTVTIDELADVNSVSFIKLDLEGGEIDALMGATKIIDRDRPVILVECVEKLMNRYGYGIGFVDRFLLERGYQLKKEHGVNRLYA